MWSGQSIKTIISWPLNFVLLVFPLIQPNTWDSFKLQNHRLLWQTNLYVFCHLFLKQKILSGHIFLVLCVVSWGSKRCFKSCSIIQHVNSPLYVHIIGRVIICIGQKSLPFLPFNIDPFKESLSSKLNSPIYKLWGCG